MPGGVCYFYPLGGDLVFLGGWVGGGGGLLCAPGGPFFCVPLHPQTAEDLPLSLVLPVATSL